jgi:hypothetical protein
MNSSPDISRLRHAVRESRHGISCEYSGLLHDLDVRRRFTESVRRHPLGWIGGAAAAGLIATLFGGSRKKTSPNPPSSATPTTPVKTVSPEAPLTARAGWLSGAMELGKLLYPVLRPVVIEMIGKAAQAGLAKKGRLQ